MTTNIKHHVLRFHKQLSSDQYHRYRSWEHCYRHFRQHDSFTSDGDIDLAALHLGFFLASWGMYRGSSFLLQKDYRVHLPIVQELLEKKYASLWNLDVESLTYSSPEIKLIFELAKRIKQIYKQGNPAVNGIERPADASDILVTKIMLGTMCCTPAYDDFFSKGLRSRHMVKKFGRNSYFGLLDFYKKHKTTFDEAATEIASFGMPYPVMKLIDMHFWSIGYALDQ